MSIIRRGGSIFKSQLTSFVRQKRLPRKAIGLIKKKQVQYNMAQRKMKHKKKITGNTEKEEKGATSKGKNYTEAKFFIFFSQFQQEKRYTFSEKGRT